MITHPHCVVLAILDGWGIAPQGSGNAISQAKTPNLDGLSAAFVHTQLIAHGESVGLPKREPGNTETGHLNIGAGRIVYQDLPRINMSIADGSFFQNKTIIAALDHSRNNKSNLHILGLIGGGGVHSDISHLFAILRLCHEHQSQNVFLHLFTDGRDSPPTSSRDYISQVAATMKRESIGQIATIMGRYYAMDRDFRWDRTAKAYNCLVNGQGKSAQSIEQAISDSYTANITDEFIEPTSINNSPRIKNDDAVIFFNFRIDRPRQLTKAFVLPDFATAGNITGFDPYAIEFLKTHNIDATMASRPKPFQRDTALQNLFFVTMTEYEKNLPVQTAFPPQIIDYPLGRVVSEAGLRQLRMSESEKERFVTYYFNGQREHPFSAEEHLIIPSPKVATYDLKPEMSARQITDHLIQKISSRLYQLIVVNFANADMVGHTGNISATVIGCQTVDECIGKLASTIQSFGDVLCITADHGNAEEMINRSTGDVDTEHNANPVPFIIVGKQFQNALQISQGILADIAPTLLSIMNIPVPPSMAGSNLLR